jgi:hypothetical protein
MLGTLVLCALACRTPITPGDSRPADSSPPVDTPGETGEPPIVVLVNELMADNEGAVQDPDGGHPDWLELYNPGEEPVDLGGFALSDDWTDKACSVLPEGTLIEPGGWLLFWADGREESGHVAFSLSADGEGVGLFAPDGTAQDWINYPAQAEDYAWARLPDGAATWEAVARGTPGAANARIFEQSVVLVERGATWSYLDGGVYPGEGWTGLHFDDSGWASGPAPLGYGDDQPTQVSWGEDSAAKHITTWFRRRFTVAGDASASAASVELRVDDGALVWLDGAELLRQGMGAGEVGPDTLATDTVSGDAETVYTAWAVNPGLLAGGDHVLAVEVHQASAGSSDLTLDLSLTLRAWVAERAP